MPISKKEAMNSQNSKLNIAVENACREIDNRLLLSLKASYNIPYGLDSDQKTMFFERIKQLYQQVGWTVTRHNDYDQRDQTNWDYVSIT